MEKHPLQIKNPELQKSDEVQKSVEKKERLSGEKTPNDPKDRIETHIERLEKIFLNPDERVRKRNIEMLRPAIYDAFIIKPEEVPDSYFELQQRIARERGIDAEHITPEIKKQMIDTIIEDQKHSLDNIINYLTSDDAVYPSWFKYFVFTQLTKLSQFDKSLGKFKKRTKETVAPYPDIYQEALAQVCDTYEKVAKDNNLLKTDPEVQKDFQRSFPKVYAEKITESIAAKMERGEEIAGEWIKYEQGNDNDAQRLYDSLQGKGTGWCTAGQSTAETQIKSGDFYVYYTYDQDGKPTQPRVAIRMEGKDKIGEVRGISEHQSLEPQFADILDEKLDDFGDEKKKYEKKTSNMRRLTDIDNRFKDDSQTTLSKEDLRFLYEIDDEIEGFGYDKDPRIAEILEGRDVKKDLSYVLNCKSEQISITKKEALSGDIVYHYGSLDLDSLTSAEGLNLPQSIGGDLNLYNLTSAEGLNLPQSIGGNLNLYNLTSAEGLNLPQSIGGDLYLNRLTSAEGLNLPQSIGGNLNLDSLTSAEGLNLPQSIGGDLYLRSLTSAEGLNLPQSIGGNLNLDSLTSAEGLNLPQSIGGNLNLYNLTSAEGLNLPQSIGGNLYLNRLTSAEGLNLPQSIGGNLNLDSLTSAEGLNLPQSIGGDLNLYNLTSAEGLNLPQSIGGNLNLRSLTSAEGLNLPQSIGGNLNLRSLTSAEGLNLPQSIGGDLYLNSLTSAEGLNLPQSIGGGLYLNSLTSAEGLNLPQSIGGILALDSLTSAEKEKLIEKYPQYKEKIG